MVFADNQHLTLRHTEASIVLEASGDMLFEPGGASISEEGRQALDRLVPFLLNLSYPAVISGHSATGYSEGVRTTLTAERLVDNSWALSMDRAQAVYRHFIEHGVDRYMLKLESFGSHHPAYDNATPEGRLRNRRVDIALDKRNPGLAASFGRQGVPADGSYIFRDFEFDLNLVSPAEREGRR